MADPAPAPAPKGILLKADTIAEPFLAEVKANLAAAVQSTSASTLPRCGPPKLVGILATASAAPSRSYAEFTRKQCVALGIAFELREVDQDDGVEEAIIEANADSSVDGIMVRLSIFIAHLISYNFRYTTRFSGRNRYSSCLLAAIQYLCAQSGPLLATDRLAFQRRRRPQLQVPLQPLPQVTSPTLFTLPPYPFALTSIQHPLPRAKVASSILTLSRRNSTSPANQRCRPASRNRQVDPPMHASGRGKSARARRCLQRAVALRRPRLRPHRNRHQPVIYLPTLLAQYQLKTICAKQKIGSGRPPSRGAPRERRCTRLFRRHRFDTGV